MNKMCGKYDIHQIRIPSHQYKIIHRFIPCRKKLFDWKISDTPNCKFCNKIEDLKHFYLSCSKWTEFWIYFYKWWNNMSELKEDIYIWK